MPGFSRTFRGLFITTLGLTAAAAALAEAHHERNGLEAAPDQPDAAPVHTRQLQSLGAATRAFLMLKHGDEPFPGEPVTVLNPPFTNDLGQIGFVGATNDGGGNDHFVWLDGQIVWRNSDADTYVVSGGEGTMGISDAGDFIYSPSTDGRDSVWTRTGPLAVAGEAAPGFATGTVSTFHSRPTMSANGVAHWVAGVHFSGGTASQARVLYRADDATPATIAPVLRSGDIVDGHPVSASGIRFDYQASDNGEHLILGLIVDSGSTSNDTLVWVDGTVVARESQPTGDGDNWAGLDSVSINNDGDFLFSGDTDGNTANDEFIAYNGDIALREGDTLDGITLAVGAAVQALSINDLGQAVHIWSHGSGDHLFIACDAADLAGSIRVLSTGESVDLDGDGSTDAFVSDLNASAVISPGLDLAEDGRVAVNVDLDFDDGKGERQAVIALLAPYCGVDVIFRDGFESPPRN